MGGDSHRKESAVSTTVRTGRWALSSRLLATTMALVAALLVTTGAAAGDRGAVPAATGAAVAATASGPSLATVLPVARESAVCEGQCAQQLASHVAREWVLCWDARDAGAACEAHLGRQLASWEANLEAYGHP